MSNKHRGGDFDAFLKEEGLLAEVSETATKRLLAFQFAEAMKKKRLSKVTLAARMQTSRSALDRLLDPDNHSVTLQTLERAALVLGKSLRITLIEPAKAKRRNVEAQSPAIPRKRLRGKIELHTGYDHKPARSR
jgi:antitoxin HicB